MTSAKAGSRPMRPEAGSPAEALAQDRFVDRHVGPDAREESEMLRALGQPSLEALIDAAVPASIRSRGRLAIPEARSERDALAAIAAIAAQNQVSRSFIGMGYSNCVTPPVLLRGILENPGWYTQYTPYQPEISQGRLELLLNYQTMVADLTRLPIANASLLDEATAAAEAMHLCLDLRKDVSARTFFVAEDCHPQTIDVVRTRARPLGIEVVVDQVDAPLPPGTFGALFQYPATDGHIRDLRPLCERAHAAGVLVAVACDLLALCLLEPPGTLGADVAVGSSQRFGVPLGYGGPHAAFFATREEHKRSMPGRLVGVSIDRRGKPALRLALQTREQHIRREKATSNICTAQVLLAVIAGAYAAWHGPDGLRGIARRVHALTTRLAQGLLATGRKPCYERYFDTLRLAMPPAEAKRILAAAEAKRFDLRRYPLDPATPAEGVGISLDETTTEKDVAELLEILTGRRMTPIDTEGPGFGDVARTSSVLQHPVFNTHRSETEMMRYLERLRSRDLSLTASMIPLGSCTMKLNAAAEMLPVTWAGFGGIHPFAPLSRTKGYQLLFRDLEAWLCEITGFAACSLQPNAGSQGEYAGLQAIRAYHEDHGAGRRDVCLIPRSAHGTNPASAAMAGMRVVVVECDERGNIDLADLGRRAEEHAPSLAALMVTYPSTHGVFEESIRDVCALVHRHGGQVYMDGANLNAQVGLCKPGEMGADVCHINLHKTFCIPHGGGGPGMGPICVAKHLAPYLPGHPVIDPFGTRGSGRTSGSKGGANAIGAISAAPWGSASILPISWMYIAMMGPDGARRASEIAILNANYVAKRLSEHFPILYRGMNGLVAHECIVDVRPLKVAGVEVEDVAKRLMDYGFHAPTMSFPVAGTLMVEPTESETKAEIDRFCDALIAIREEACAIERGDMDARDNPLKNAPHTLDMVTASAWTHPYSRETAAFPAPWQGSHKFWPHVGRIEQAYGDKNLVCSCPDIRSYS